MSETYTQAWVKDLERQGLRPYVSQSGRCWIRFHRIACQPYPPNDTSPIDLAEVREILSASGVLALSTHRDVRPGEAVNGYLYLCRDKNYGLDTLSANNRSKVRRGLKRLAVRQVDSSEIARSGYGSYRDTCLRHSLPAMTQAEFQTKWERGRPIPGREIWAAYSSDEEIVAYGVLRICGPLAELASTQSTTEAQRDYSNHALFYSVIKDVMRRPQTQSISYGLSTLQVETRADTLHHFKLSVGLEAVPIRREIHLAPPLRAVALNPAARRLLPMIQRKFPQILMLRLANGALQLVV